MRHVLEQEREEFYQEIVEFVEGRSHNILPDTIKMTKAEIAKRLIEETPALLGERKELIKAIEATYSRDHSEKVPF